MPYDLSDPRSSLASAAPATAGATFPPQSFAFGDLPPDEADSDGTSTWWVRSQSCVVAYTRAETGSLLTREGQVDEYVLIVGPDSDVSVSTDHGDQRVSEAAVVVMPPGASAVTAHGPCVLVRVFTAQSADLTRKCKNAVMFEHDTDTNVAPYEPWPLPPEGFKLRVYPLTDVPVQPGRFGRIFRCSTLMINMLPVDDGPRDTTKLSPHAHADFEQISLQLDGDYIHHLRTPWTPNLAVWRDDEHLQSASPAVVVIPPPLIHTSRGVGDTRHQLVDIFCPPRLDFSSKPGWVLNAADYPATARC